MTKQEWYDRYGQDVMEQARLLYETYYDKDFYRDLDEFDILEYVWKALS